MENPTKPTLSALMNEQEYERHLRVLMDPNAPWRKMPATQKQRDILARFGIEHAPEITAGEASDLILQASARRRRQRQTRQLNE
jgi:hypothetical protein